jgi:hypothetical protein
MARRMGLAIEDLAAGFGGLIAWIAILVVIVGVGLLMRHLSVAGRLPGVRQAALLVAACSVLLVLAGVGGVALMQGTTAGG